MVERVVGADEVGALGIDSDRGGDSDVLRQRPAFTEIELVQGMRRNEEAAFAEFLRRFRPLLLYEARRLGIQPGLREEFVDDCMTNVALRLRKHTSNIPRSLAPYLVRALRLHRLYKRRSELRQVHLEDASDWERAVGDGMERSTLSEATTRASAGPEHEDPPVVRALEHLIELMELNDEERQLLVWRGSHVPQSEIAEWLGISHGAVRNRVMRLRDRLKRATSRCAAELSLDDRRELAQWLRRMNVFHDETTDER